LKSNSQVKSYLYPSHYSVY